jgi:hypothetical protein
MNRFESVRGKFQWLHIERLLEMREYTNNRGLRAAMWIQAHVADSHAGTLLACSSGDADPLTYVNYRPLIVQTAAIATKNICIRADPYLLPQSAAVSEFRRTHLFTIPLQAFREQD